MSDRPANRLANETSPYLLQHAHNPVDWYPWGGEAFALAKREDKPVFLSIGYSACHWCHVMERESFENEEIAALLNEHFVSIKVDREERPEIDSIYMQAVQMMTGHGGWPMSMFLTPEGLPFFGGTYFPPDDRHGIPGFPRVLAHVSELWRSHRPRISEATSEIRAALANTLTAAGELAAITRDGLDQAARQIAASYDPVNGGFGGAPKFPPSMAIEFLLQVAARTGSESLLGIVTTTLERMANGGIYDQVGGGFHRYSTDERWLVPHFEKMLYDNALLVRLYTRAWQFTRNPFYARIANETLGFVEREMTSPEGGFYSTLDADSEGEEGRFYVWRREEVMDVLGEDDGRIFCALYDVTDRGNWESRNILNVPLPRDAVAADLGMTVDDLEEVAARGRCMLFGRRSDRVRPARDEKILAGWNGWMLAAVAEAALAFDSNRHREAARRNADFLIRTFVENGRIRRTTRDGDTRLDGVLEDYAGVAWGLVAAFEATQERRYLDVARSLAETILARFRDEKDGGLFDTADDHESLIVRPKDPFDNASPAGSSVAADVLLRLALYFAEPPFERAARGAVASIWPLASRYPSGFGHLLGVAEWIADKPLEIAITGRADDPSFLPLVHAASIEYLPHRIFVWSDTDLPLMEGRPADRTAAWICEGYACQAPVETAAELEQALRLKTEE